MAIAKQKRIVVVGGVAGGASAATRARRLSEEAEITLFERGEQISFANCGMPYHIGGTIPDRARLLVQTADGLRKRYRIDVRTRSEVLRIDRAGRQVQVRNLATGEEYWQPYDALILSPGADPVRPPIPGAASPRVFTLRSLADMDRIKRVIDEQHPERAVIVGGGYIGLEMAEALRHRKVGVTLVELAPQVFSAADPEMVAPIQQQLELHGVDLRLGSSITSIQDLPPGGLHVCLSNGESVDCGLVIMAVGVRPEVKLARDAGLEIGPVSGGMVVDEQMRTSDPHIWAIGDAVEGPHLVSGLKGVMPLAGPANRQGRIAADNALGGHSVYGQSQGTAICKVFDLAIGITGLSERALKQAGRTYEKVYVHPSDHATYYPGASQLSLKLLFDPTNGKILGGQVVGAHGVDKRIDVLAVAIRAGPTVDDLKDQELSYAPPYGSAKDALNYAGFVASNVMAGLVRICHVEDVTAPAENQMLLDVRTPEEVQAGTIPGAKNIPIDDLRQRLDELPRDKEILAFCRVGLRGYLACRILEQRGFRCRNLTGGYLTYQAAAGLLKGKNSPPKKEMTQDTGEKELKVNKQNSAAQPAAPDVVREIDCRGLQCPGPIMRLKNELGQVGEGQSLRMIVSDPGFPSDVAAWCHSTGHTLVGLKPQDGAFQATVRRSATPAAAAEAQTPKANKKTMVVFSGDFDKAMAAFVIANGAVAMGSEVTLFFTFWGLNILRRPEQVSVRKNLIERMFGWMMPRGADKLALSQMNMGGMGLRMIKGIMARKGVASLPELIASAQQAGVRLVACTMSMDLMGIHREELVDGVEEGGVATFLDNAEASNVNLFI